ncbi:hypothetical protein GSI_12437 [Ganoderma sinense ZZ0214-1]|uniref:Fungal-type protein kinase domain-containing protein n=1 Tax=Ganoderma sinense ZZ0214-1 TaxID=1077348 RepID=A0A2G8RSS9_9APHY|nr:hypothetical protein GSI_12437 [Ganoderma sinense ZZ0214-1]
MANPPPPEPPTDGVSALHIGAPVDAAAAPSSHGSPSDPLPPPTTPPAAQPKFPQHHPYEFKSTPLRPSKNDLDIAQKGGRLLTKRRGTTAARRVTTLTSQDVINTKLTEKDLESGDFGRRSWYHMAALGEIKTFDSKDCAFYMMSTETKKKRRKEKKEARKAAEADTTQADDDEESEEPQPPSTTDALPENVADTADNFEDEGGDVPQLGPPIDVPEGKPYIRKGPHPESGLGQLGDYMHNLSACQHRLFSYGFYVQWRWARLLYFDRTGALVSEPFDWTEASSPLHDFVWKFAHMTPEQRGYDPTAQEASYAEMSEVLAAANAESLPKAIQPYVKKAFCSNDEAANHSGEDGLDWDLDESPIYRLTVTSSPPSADDVFPDSEPIPPPTDVPGTSERTFLVGRPQFVADSLIGRCTRGYIAWDITEKRFCFLKDSWRPLVPGRARPEHLVYERLHDARVSRITTLVCGGDVGGPLQQRTDTHDYFPENKRPVPRVHYRIVTREVGVPLTEFADFGELAHVFEHALIAHYLAWTNAGVLHRDVSVGNILIDPVTRNGYLIDWDLSRLRIELEDGPVEPDRTGTWQFRSALSLAFPRKPYRLSDDIESFVHTYRWLVLRYHRTDQQDFRSFIQSEYEMSALTVITGIHVGGQQKLRSFTSSSSLFQVVGNDNLQRLLDNLAHKCFLHYRLVDKARMRALYGVPSLAPVETDQPNAPLKGPYADEDVADVMTILMQEQSDSDDPFEFDVPQHTAPAGVDPCDVVGPLSDHTTLFKIFHEGIYNGAPRQGDQFHLRAAEEPSNPVLNVSSKGISSMSQSQTQDGKPQPPPRPQAVVPQSTPQNAAGAAEPLPSSDASDASYVSFSSAPGRKRRQDDDDVHDAGTAATEVGGTSTTEAQVSKRQKKTRARV